MTASGSVQGIVAEVLTEIKEIEDEIVIAPENMRHPGEKIEFQPLTDEEKEKFVDSLDAKARQNLAELAGETEAPTEPDPNVVPFCTL